MEFRVLGPIELWSAGQQCDLGPTRVRSVLAILTLTPRTLVPTDVLIDRVWDTQPPAKARESLSVYVTRLRGSLRQAIGESVRLTGRDSGYELDVDPDTIDLHQFRRLRRQADASAAAGDAGHAALLLREADGLWHGQAFAGIRGDWMARMRDSLEEERRAAILKRVECELELGRHGDLVGELHHLLAQYPLDEAFISHQMTALYRSGRPGEALSLYRDIRSRLIEEQGTEPGPLLSELHQRILRHDPQLAVRAAGPVRAGSRGRTRCRPGRRSSWAAARNSNCSPARMVKPRGSVSSRAWPGWGRPRWRSRRPARWPGSTRTGRSTSTCTPTIPGTRRSTRPRRSIACSGC